MYQIEIRIEGIGLVSSFKIEADNVGHAFLRGAAIAVSEHKDVHPSKRFVSAKPIKD
jgi:hypothetical protein